MRLGQAGRQRDGLAKRIDGGACPTLAIAGDGELILDFGLAVVERQALLVALGRPGMAPEAGVDVALPFEDPWCRRIQLRRAPQVAEGSLRFAALPIGEAALEVSGHRVGPQGDGTGIGLDSRRQVGGAEGRVAGQDQPLVLALSTDRDHGQGRAHGERQAGPQGQRPSPSGRHEPMVTATRRAEPFAPGGF